jgi:ATP-binding cassette subfamily B protein
MSSEFITRTPYRSDHSSALRFIWSHVRRHPQVAVLMTFGALLNATLGSALFILVGMAFNAIIRGNDLSTVAWAAVGAGVSQIARGAFQLMRNFAAETFAQRTERDVRDELYASLLGKSMAYHDLQPVGETMARVTNDVRQMNYMLSPGMNLIVGSGMFLIMPVIVAPTIYPSLILVPLLFFITYVYTQALFFRRLHAAAQEVRASFGRMNARLAETLDGVEVVKGTAQEEQEVIHFNDLVNEVRDRFVRQGDVEARYVAILLLGLANVAGFLHAILLYRAGLINAGDIIAFMGQLALLGFPVFSSLWAFSNIASGYAGAERILKVIVARTDLDQNLAGRTLPIQGEIEFRGVSFGYLAEKEMLHDISFTVKTGQTVAIVGQTGAGKTTLAKLINRTYDVSTGQVLIDGADVRDWNLSSLRSQISIIEQEIFLFSRSVTENIRFGKPDAPQPDIEDAARKAQAHDFILRLPQGYDTIIGQRGVTLSGGQRQRLAIARAFLADPRILILDDSTSAIDSATEDHIQKAIWTAAKGRTTILITHRLSQIRWADQIVVLRRGQVVAQGAHEELLRVSEPYRRIFARYEAKTTFVDREQVRKLLDQTSVEGE